MASDQAGSVLALLRARLTTDGVSSAKVSDGEVFMFTAATLRKLLEAAEASEEKDVTVFVKTGPNFTKVDVQ